MKQQDDLEAILEDLYRLNWNRSTVNDVVDLTFHLQKHAKNIIKQSKRKKVYKITVDLEKYSN